LNLLGAFSLSATAVDSFLSFLHCASSSATFWLSW